MDVESGIIVTMPESTDMESEIHSEESGIQDSLGLPYMGRKKSARFARA